MVVQQDTCCGKVPIKIGMGFVLAVVLFDTISKFRETLFSTIFIAYFGASFRLIG